MKKFLLSFALSLLTVGLSAQREKVPVHPGEPDIPDFPYGRSLSLVPEVFHDGPDISVSLPVYVDAMEIVIKDSEGNVVLCESYSFVREAEVECPFSGDYFIEIYIGEESFYGEFSA